MPALAVLLLVTAAALAEERTVSIQDAPGLNAVEVNCGACHSRGLHPHQRIVLCCDATPVG